MIYDVTGLTKSRLVELEKWKRTTIFTEKYVAGGNYTNNGVDYNNSDEWNKIVYYIDGIRYIDDILNHETTYLFKRDDNVDLDRDLINKPYIKDVDKIRIVSKPSIDNDVFIDRQYISIMDKVYSLEYVKNLNELLAYVGGKYYNIKNNTK